MDAYLPYKTDNEDLVNKVLIISSLVFITNALSASHKQYYLYAFLFTLLTITSLLTHSDHGTFINILDKLVIAAIVIYGGKMLYEKQNQPNSNIMLGIAIIITFLFVVWVYYYGHYCKKYCFDMDPNISNKWHVIMHLVGSFGHHLIILG